MKDDPDAVWVESGTFRVDRDKALAVLAVFQLPDPSRYLLCWVRSACAAGATRISLRRWEDRLEMRFDSAPFEPEELRDPYASLFDKGAKRHRRAPLRHLAYGLLAALRAGPSSVEVVSGVGERRVCLSAAPGRTERVDPCPEDKETETVVWVLGAKGHAAEQALRHVRESCSLSRAEILVDGEKAAPKTAPDSLLRLEFSEGDVYGSVSVPDGAPPASKVRFYSFGVFVAEVEVELPSVQVHAGINDDRFSLNASLGGVSQNDRYRAALRLLGMRSEVLLQQVSRALSQRLPDTGRLLRASDPARLDWSRALASGPWDRWRRLVLALRSLWIGRHPEADLARVEEDAAGLRWLRGLCGAHLNGVSGPHGEDQGRRLRGVPLFLSAAGTVLTLQDVETLSMREPGLRFWAASWGELKPELARVLGPERILWCASSSEVDFLSPRFPIHPYQVLVNVKEDPPAKAV
ncbi:MAG: hypothetical protein WC728_03290 [Elusimicrobiota bacterium]